MLTPLQITLMSTGTLLLLVWVVLLVRGRAHAALFTGLDAKDFPLRELYPIGYELLERSGYSFRTRSDLKLRQLMDIVYGVRYSEFYVRTIRAQQVSLALTGAIVAFALYGFTDDVRLLALALVTALAISSYYSEQIKTRVRNRNESMMRDFCDVVSMLALLSNAGMIIREAWVRTSHGGTTPIYDEMRRAIEQMENGVPDSVAIQEFGTRSMVPEIKKVTALLVQSMRTGGADLPAMLTQQSSEAWHMKKQLVQRESNKAGTRLMLPMMLMFAGVLIIVVVPMFSRLGG